jgi:hypothetical protein
MNDEVHHPQNALWHHVQPFLKQNLDGLSHYFWTHLWCPAGSSVKCGHFVAGFFRHVCDVGQLFNKMWMFCRMISDHICEVHAAVQQNVDVRFVTGFWDLFMRTLMILDTFVMTNWLLGKTWTFCRTFFIRLFCDDQPPVKGTVSWFFAHVFCMENSIIDTFY